MFRLETVRKFRFSRIFRGSGGEEDAAADKIEVSASIHLALDEFELVDLTFRLTAAPGQGQRRAIGRSL
jgi:hypothetical protein